RLSALYRCRRRISDSCRRALRLLPRTGTCRSRPLDCCPVRRLCPLMVALQRQPGCRILSPRPLLFDLLRLLQGQEPQPPPLTPKTSFGSFSLCYPPRLEGFWRNSNAAGQGSKVDYPWGSRERLNELRLFFVFIDDLKNANLFVEAYADDSINHGGFHPRSRLPDNPGRESNREGPGIPDRNNYTPVRAKRALQLAGRANTCASNTNMVPGGRGIRGATAVDWPT